MAYYIDDEKVSLEGLFLRIQSTDLIPSRATLLEGMKEKFEALKKLGISTLKGLRAELKNSKNLETLALSSGIETEYLILLRREIEGYFPKPFALKEFDRLPVDQIDRLIGKGIRDSASFFETVNGDSNMKRVIEDTGIDTNFMRELVCLSDLTRVQWVSPTAARMLVETGVKSSHDLALADAEKLCEDLDRINQGSRFFKGKIGLRDVKRLIHAAGYIPELEELD